MSLIRGAKREPLIHGAAVADARSDQSGEPAILRRFDRQSRDHHRIIAPLEERAGVR